MMNTMMQETLLTGTAHKAELPGWQAAGKTGTSQDFRDAWFVGYTKLSRRRGLARQRRRQPDQEGFGRQPAGRDLEPVHEVRARGRPGRPRCHSEPGRPGRRTRSRRCSRRSAEAAPPPQPPGLIPPTGGRASCSALRPSRRERPRSDPGRPLGGSPRGRSASAAGGARVGRARSRTRRRGRGPTLLNKIFGNFVAVLGSFPARAGDVRLFFRFREEAHDRRRIPGLDGRARRTLGAVRRRTGRKEARAPGAHGNKKGHGFRPQGRDPQSRPAVPRDEGRGRSSASRPAPHTSRTGWSIAARACRPTPLESRSR